MTWCVGKPVDVRESRKKGTNEADIWWPCEAVVRVACNEMQRLPDRLTGMFPKLYNFECAGWANTFLTMFAEALTKTVEHEKSLEKDMFKAKRKSESPTEPISPTASAPAPILVLEQEDAAPAEEDASGLGSKSFEVGTSIDTPYGNGTLVKKRRECHKSPDGNKYLHLKVNEIVLDFGGTLYRPDLSSVSFDDTEEISADETDTKPTDSFSLSGGIGKFHVGSPAVPHNFKFACV